MQTSHNGDVGIFGIAGQAGNSLHVDEERANVSVGPLLDSFKGGKNVFLGVKAGENAMETTENVVVGWYAGGGMGRSNVVAGSRAAQYVQKDTTYSVVLGALAGYTSSTVSNSILIGAKAAEGVTTMTDAVIAGVNTKAMNDVVQSVFVGVDSTIGGLFGEASRRVTALVNGSWIGGRDVVAVGNGILTQDRSLGIVAVGNNINAGSANNLAVGIDISLDVRSFGVEVFGRGTSVSGPHANVLALGAGIREITRGDAEFIGSGIFYDRVTQEMSFMDGMVTVDASIVNIGGMVKVKRGESVTMKSVTMEAIALTGDDGLGWRLSIEPVKVGEHDLVFTSSRGTRVVFHDHFEAGVTNFTGQHRCVLKEGCPRARVGMLLVATGRYCDLHGFGVSVDEAIPVVEVSTRSADPRVFGVVSSVEAKGSVSRRVDVGHIGFDLAKECGEMRVVVNSCGEGGIWVCDEGGPCSNGDLLCSSSRPGYAMRQAVDVVTNFTCAKVTSDCTFGIDGTCFTGCVYKF
jgi:hypothetical protein